jgi:hypothetical protein
VHQSCFAYWNVRHLKHYCTAEHFRRRSITVLSTASKQRISVDGNKLNTFEEKKIFVKPLFHSQPELWLFHFRVAIKRNDKYFMTLQPRLLIRTN